MAAVLAAACTTPKAIPAQPPSVTLSRLDVEVPGVRLASGVTLLAAYRLAARDAGFGGFSAIETDGRTLWLLSDRGQLWQAAFAIERESGALELSDWRRGRILGDDADRGRLDPEALAIAADGGLIAAFEHDASLRRLVPTASGDWRTERLHAGALEPEGWRGAVPVNRGIEALAVTTDGLLALWEGVPGGSPLAHGLVLGEDGQRPVRYRVSPGFNPVGAASDGADLYVLERSLSFLGGWQSRLRRVRLDRDGPLEGPLLARIDAGPLAENYEGVALLPQPDGATLVLLVADDNLSALQRTLLLVLEIRSRGGNGRSGRLPHAGGVALAHQEAERQQHHTGDQQLDAEIADRPADPW